MVGNLPAEFAHTQPAFALIAEGSLTNSLNFVNNEFPLYSKESEVIWKRYIQDVRRTGVKGMDDLVLLADVFTRKQMSVNTFWTKLMSECLHLVKAESTGLQSLLSLTESFARINYRSEPVLIKLTEKSRVCFVDMTLDDISRLVLSLSKMQLVDKKLLIDLSEEIVERADEFSSKQLVDMLNALAKLEIADDDMYRAMMRVLHRRLAAGELTPWEKAKLARSYALLKMEHITFFKTVAGEIIASWETFQRSVALGEAERTDPNFANLESITGRTPPVGTMFDELTLDPYYELGFGRPFDFGVSGLVGDSVDVKKAVEQAQERQDMSSSSSASPAPTGAAALPSGSHILPPESLIRELTVGQIAVVVDSLNMLKFHRWAPYFPSLLDIVIKKISDPDVIPRMDPMQLTCCMSILAQNRRGNATDLDIIKGLINRMFDLYLRDLARPSALSLFLKELVVWRTYKKPVRKFKRTWYTLEYIAVEFLNAPAITPQEEKDALLAGTVPRKKPGPLEILGQHVCKRVHHYTLREMSSTVRSFSYLGFADKTFYAAFIPYFKERVHEMGAADISNVRDTLNRRKLNEPHLFYLMGKQFQKDQADQLVMKYRGLVVKRVG